MANGAPRGPGRIPKARPQMMEDRSPEGQLKAELASGLRCRGCHRHLIAGSVELLMLAPMKDPLARTSGFLTDTEHACCRRECDYFERTAPYASAVRRIENPWLILDERIKRGLFNNPEMS